MPQRPISEARQALEDKLPKVSDWWANTYRAELEAAEGQARSRGEVHVEDRINNTREEQRELTEQICAVRDELEDLAKRGSQGELSAQEYGDAMRRLTSRRDRLEKRLSSIEARAERLSEIEEDPAGYIDSLYKRYPALQRPEFSF